MSGEVALLQTPVITEWRSSGLSTVMMKQIVNKIIGGGARYLPQSKAKPLMTYRENIVQICRVCNDVTHPFQEAYGKFWYHCPNCDFLQSEVSRSLLSTLNKGQGLGAGTGVGGGGYREYWISKLLHKELGLSRILLYGTGNTPTFQKLHEEGVDVWGCDISADLVADRKERYRERFFDAREFPQVRFDVIIAVEVLEHLLTPMKIFKLFSEHLTLDGMVAGTTDFYEGGDISEHDYVKSPLHISYWSKQSLQTAASSIGRFVSLFKLECPGSVYPDEKFGLLWPRKRVFFLYSEKFTDYFRNLAERYQILPIDKP